jgi:hypothetical protein
VVDRQTGPGHSDVVLLSATRSQPDAFAAFYDRYEEAVVGYLLRRTGDVEVAVDLVSEAFAAALAAASRYKPAGATAAPWLFTRTAAPICWRRATVLTEWYGYRPLVPQGGNRPAASASRAC